MMEFARYEWDEYGNMTTFILATIVNYDPLLRLFIDVCFKDGNSCFNSVYCFNSAHEIYYYAAKRESECGTNVMIWATYYENEYVVQFLR